MVIRNISIMSLKSSLAYRRAIMDRTKSVQTGYCLYILS